MVDLNNQQQHSSTTGSSCDSVNSGNAVNVTTTLSIANEQTSLLPLSLNSNALSKICASDLIFEQTDKPLIDAQNVQFDLPIPVQPANLNNQNSEGELNNDGIDNKQTLGYICESASRLLFLSVHWVKGIKALSEKFVIHIKKY